MRSKEKGIIKKEIIEIDITAAIPLLRAVRAGNLPEVKKLLREGHDVNMQERFRGLTPLITACIEGNKPMAELLMANGAQINLPCNQGSTPLIRAIIKNRLALVKFLVEKGADVNMADMDGHTPLIIGVQHGTLPILKYLINRGADVNIHDSQGMTPVLLACALDAKEELARYLISLKGVDLDWYHFALKAGEGGLPLRGSALTYVIIRCSLDLIKCLVEHGADINAYPSPEGTPPILLAVEQYHKYGEGKEIVEYLIAAGAHTTIKDADGNVILQMEQVSHDRANAIIPDDIIKC